jgi:hypothetical protein
MNRSLLRRMSALLVVAVLLSTTAWAGGGARLDPSPGLFATVWQLLSSLIAASDGRAGMDPNGLTAPTTDVQAATDSDGRATMDPNG